MLKLWTDFTRVLIKELKERSQRGLPFTASSLHLGVAKRIRDETFAEQPKNMPKSPPLTPIHFSVSEDTTLPGIILMPLGKAPGPRTNLSPDTDQKLSRNERSKHNDEATGSEVESSEEEDEMEIIDAGDLSGSDTLGHSNADNLPSEEEEGNSTAKGGITQDGNKTAKKGKARIKVAVDIEIPET